jgi:ribose 5-phosphate isomerase B
MNMEKERKIALAADHAGYATKEAVKKFLIEQGYTVVQDFGTDREDSVDYPDFIHPLADAVSSHTYDFGLVFCGSGNGVNITANKHKGIRSALCWEREIAELARGHNNANVCAIPARYIPEELAKEIVFAFITTEFEGGRHERRVDKIEQV